MGTRTRKHPLDRQLAPSVLRLLVLVEDLGGVGAAARVVGVSQPTASRALTGLESRLGVMLLRRTALGTSLTAEGLALSAQARLVLAAYDRLESVVADMGPDTSGQLKLAASRTVGEQLVPGWLAAVGRERPDLQVQFHVGNSDAVIHQVRAGEVPLGFVEVPTPPADLASEVLLHDRMVVIVSPGHPWAGGTVTLHHLGLAHLVERERGSGTRSMVDTVLPHRSSPAAEFDSNTAIIHAVAAGIGPAVLSELTIGNAARDGDVVVVPWSHEPPRRPLCAIWQPALSSSRLVRDILAIVRTDVSRTRRPMVG
jgi:DNA-binding transcriptional LysR family regulator